MLNTANGSRQVSTAVDIHRPPLGEEAHALVLPRTPNVLSPLSLDADRFDYDQPVDLVFTANTFHIMHWPTVCRMIAGTGRALHPGGRLVVYGPFHVGGCATSASNARFDASLRASDPGMGVRGREPVCWRADAAGLSLTGIRSMPANNQVLVFERRA